MIHFNPQASEGSRLILFQRDFLLAHQVIARLYEVVNRYFIQRALSWLSPHNVALENPPFVKEALTSLSSLPEEVSVENLLLTIIRGRVFYC